MQTVFVDHLSFALGDKTYTVEQATARESIVSSPDVLRQAGFAQHYVCRPGTTAYDLAQRAVQGIQTALGDIGAIVYSTCLPTNANVGDAARFRATRDVKYLMDFPASHLQSQFGLERATVIGLTQQACTGMLGSLRLARTLLIAEPDIQRVLCVTADRFPDGALYEQAYTLMSDGAAACIVSTVPAGFRLVALQALTNGGLATASDDETVGSYFSYGYRTIQQTLAQAELGIADIDWIVPQNVNIRAWHNDSTVTIPATSPHTCTTFSTRRISTWCTSGGFVCSMPAKCTLIEPWYFPVSMRLARRMCCFLPES